MNTDRTITILWHAMSGFATKALLFFLIITHSLAAHSIVFIHLGSNIPHYLPVALEQARLFNKHCPIYLVANGEALKKFPIDPRYICVKAESLTKEPAHEVFMRCSRLNSVDRGGFWMFTTERFFYLFALMKQFDLRDVFHLEYDNMLYADVAEFLPVMQKHYQGMIGATFDNDQRGIGGCLYVANPLPMERFTYFIVENLNRLTNDMEFLAHFKNAYQGIYIDHLPIVMPAYLEDHELASPSHHHVNNPGLYSNHCKEFSSIFDAAAIGQYLGGIDPRNGPSLPGFINESCVVNPSFFRYEWSKDQEGRAIPIAIYRGEKWKINNLHIHSKNLKAFYSELN